nr:phosphoheptose isomerase [Candidatus Thioglobus sp.]
MSENQFIKNYLKDFIELLQPNDGLINELVKVRNLLLEVSSNNKKIIIIGNGGSASIASHFS